MNKKKEYRAAKETPRLPELRRVEDKAAIMGRSLRDRYDALRPYSDLKHWR
ncbi:MAG: hypothetical protein IJ438_11565 [Clostridia bacterium]|nr:hypothetical protein [Clostridia bacterium]